MAPAGASLDFTLRNILFRIFRTLVLPWKRTPARWSAVILNSAGQFAVLREAGQDQLPSAEVDPDQPIPSQCLDTLGLNKWSFSDRSHFKLVHIGGQGGSGVTFYFSGKLAENDPPAKLFEARAAYLHPSLLRGFVPAEVE